MRIASRTDIDHLISRLGARFPGRPRQDAEEAVSDALLAVWMRGDWNDGTPPGGLVWTIAWRSLRGRWLADCRPTPAVAPQPFADPAGVVELAETVDHAGQLIDAIRSAPVREAVREVFAGQSVTYAARTHGVARETVSRRVSKLRGTLQKT